MTEGACTPWPMGWPKEAALARETATAVAQRRNETDI
jgi:hypothetical protein